VYLNREKHLIYLANPKTASVATRDALQKSAGFVQYDPRTMAHLPLDVNMDGGLHHGRLTSPADGWSVACTVRNPWKAMLSWYTAHEHFEEPFNVEWIDSWIAMHERQYFPDLNKLFYFGTQFADVVMRVENLKSDLAAWLGWEIPLPEANVSKKKLTVEEAYTDETRDYVRVRFAKEIREYGYAYPG
jgi:hypothetical protein